MIHNSASCLSLRKTCRTGSDIAELCFSRKTMTRYIVLKECGKWQKKSNSGMNLFIFFWNLTHMITFGPFWHLPHFENILLIFSVTILETEND